MKTYLLGTLLLLTSLTYAGRFSYFENVYPEFCPDKFIDYKNDAVFCRASNPQVVINAKVGPAITKDEYSKITFSTYSATDANIVPDDSSNTVYYFTRWLVDATGKKVGVMTIEGWTNSEMEDGARFDIRYNLKGEVVKASSHPLRK